jgi:hypothetical protein
MTHARLIAAITPVLFALPAKAATTYTQTFNFPDGTTNLGDGSVIQSNDGTASVQGGQLRLTSDSAGGTAAVFHIPALLNSSLGWSAVFNFTIIDAAGENPPADGFSFNYGNITPAPGQYGAGEAGFGGPNPYVSMIVDTWQNNNPGDPPKVGVGQNNALLASTPGNILEDGTGVSALGIIVYDPATGIDFTTIGLENNASFNNISLAGFNPNDSYSFAISARTGGANQTLLIDNLTISAIAPEPGTVTLAGVTASAMLLRRRRRPRG